MTKQQRWAKHALERVLAQKGKKDESSEKKYATLCMKAPSLLRQAGLVQALAFLQARKGADDKKLDEARQLLSDLAQGLGYKDARALQDVAHEAALPAYMMLTHDAVGLAIWFRRFAQAELKHEEA